MTSAREVIAEWFANVWAIADVQPKDYDLAARDIIETLCRAGFAIVPVEPTEKMHRASWGEDGRGEEYWFEPRYPTSFTGFWQDMLTAANVVLSPLPRHKGDDI